MIIHWGQGGSVFLTTSGVLVGYVSITSTAPVLVARVIEATISCRPVDSDAISCRVAAEKTI